MSQSTIELAAVDLDDKYTREHGRVFLTGIQALVRLVLTPAPPGTLAAGHDTSRLRQRLPGLAARRDSTLQLERAKSAHIDQHHVVFQPGVNEDIAGRRLLGGTQQAGLDGEGAYDGVFCLWYGKGPGVDRSGDALRHANLAGTVEARRGGGAARRRPYLRVLDHRAPQRVRDGRRPPSRCSIRPGCRRSSTSGSTPSRSRATVAAGRR